jgi:type VII secretion-associated serine protease mycosin
MARADTVRDKCWYVESLQLIQAHKVSTGSGVTVAVVDSGVNPGQPELADRVLSGTDSGHNFTGDGQQDADGHGTGVATLVAGHGRGPSGQDGILGVAPDAKVLPVNAQGVQVNTVQAMVDGASWAIDNGAKVINLSLVTTGPDLWKPVIAKAAAHDVVVVAATGNQADPPESRYPARLSGVLAVTAVNEQGQVPGWAATGPQTALAAPGDHIPFPKLDKSYADSFGTSSAAAIVSGVAALVRAKYPDLSAAEVVRRLEATATDAGDPGRDDVYGYGIVNPLAALTEDVPPLSATPTAKAGSGNGLSGRTTTILVVGGLAVIVLLAAGAVGVAVALRRR